jgi:hypothetical protein
VLQIKLGAGVNTMAQKNPWLRTSYYPTGCLTHHLITRPAFQNFSRVWKQGALLSDAARSQAGKRSKGHIFSTDRLAGDGDYVFLSLSAPADTIRHWGYAFVFDALQVIQDYDAKVGVVDLIHARVHAVSKAIESAIDPGVTWENWPQTFIADEVIKEFKKLEKHLRLTGDDAIKYVSQICVEGKMPEILKDIRWWVQKNNIGEGHRLLWIPAALEELAGSSEIMVPEALPVSDAVGVCYEKVYFTMPDFLRFLGKRRGLPDVGPIHDVGFPYRCPFCSDPMVPGHTLVQVLGNKPWVKAETKQRDFFDVMQCASCRTWVKRGRYEVDFIEVDKEDFSLCGW